LRIVGGLVLLSVIALLFFFAFRRLRELSEDDVDVERESVLTTDLLRAQISQLFRRKSSTSTHKAPFVPVSGDDPRAHIRRTYQSMLAWAVRKGAPRPRGMSPADFAGLLGRVQPAYQGELEVVTEGYVQARYGVAGVTEEQAGLVAMAWERIMEQERIEDRSPRRALQPS